MNNGQEKRSGQRAMNRSKQASINIKTIIILLVGLALEPVHVAEGQQQTKVAKIGGLSPGSAPSATIESFLRELRKLGYVEGKNITLESRYADTKLDRLPALVDELVSLKVDVGCSIRARVTIR